MKKETIMFLALIIFILCFLALIYIGYWASTDGAKCVINPAAYYSNKTRGTCFCSKFQAFGPDIRLKP